jgi:hypothetical protein
MNECLFRIVCPFYRNRIPIHAAMYQQYVNQYCHGASENCAIMLVMKESSFLRVPKDLYPNQTFRVPDILRSDNVLGPSA